MKTRTYVLLVAAMIMGMTLIPSQTKASNNYLTTFGNYQVVSMGNNVLRFTIPLWVYGSGDDRTYYLEPNTANNNNERDCYLWYSEQDGQQRGAESVHRIVSFGAMRNPNYDGRKEGGAGYAFALAHEGVIILNNTYDSEPLVLKPGDNSHWIVNDKDDESWGTVIKVTRMNTSYTNYVVYLEMDWHMPTELQGKTFYMGMNMHNRRVGDNEDDQTHWWQWNTQYKGGDMPKSPQLQQPFIYNDASNGSSPQGKAAIFYVVYQEPISYHTSLKPNEEIPASEHSGMIIVQMLDSVRTNVSADFNVWIDTTASLSQRLASNSVTVPAYHHINNFTVSGLKTQHEGNGKWYIDSRKKQLKWEIHYPDHTDAVLGDMFEIQRAYNADYSDAETIGVVPMAYDSLTTDSISEGFGIQTYTYDDTLSAAWWNPVEKSYRIYYRIRRASASQWEWEGNNYAAFYTFEPERPYYPYRFTSNLNNLTYQLAEDFETSNQVHLTLRLINMNYNPARTEDDPGYSGYYIDPSQRFILRKILKEANDTIDMEIPRDSVMKAINDVTYHSNDNVYATAPMEIKFTDIVSSPCIHYSYEVYVDTAGVIVHTDSADYSPKPLKPAREQDKDIYFSDAANINSLTASQREFSDGVMLNWRQTDGNIGSYTIETRPAGKDTVWTVLEEGYTENWYKDHAANPYESAEWEYRLTMTYACNGNVKSDTSEVVTGSRNPYGKVSGYVLYEDGTACPGVKITAVRTSVDETVQVVWTDESGYYLLDSLVYGEGYAYAITPSNQTAEFIYNNTSSATATITLGLNDCIAENINFANKSSVRMSGRVLFQNTTVPVRGVQFRINGVTVKKGTAPYLTDASGNFEFRVPKNSAFQIQAFKNGHQFAGDGIVRMYDKDSLTLVDAQDGVRIYDETKVRLIGRLAGGRNQADKPLGFGLSQNNLGDDLKLVFELEGDNISQLVHIPSDLTVDQIDTLMRNYVRTPEGMDSVGATKVEYHKKQIIIYPDVNTGEYCVDLFPVKYKITQATATGYATLYAEGKTGESIDLTNAPLQHYTNTQDDKEVDYNEKYSITYHSPISISFIQLLYGLELGYYGEETMIRQNIMNERVDVPLAEKQADGTYRYLFGAPVFEAGNYQFRITAHEDYYYNNDPTSLKHEEVRIQGGVLKVYNGMHEHNGNTGIETKNLDQNGQTEINIPIDYVSFIKTGENALRVLDLSVEYEGAYVESQVLQAYIAGDKLKGQEFTASTHGKVVLLDILRDPPGAMSTAYIDAGAAYNYSYTSDFKFLFGTKLSVSYASGVNTYFGGFAGLGGGMWSGTQIEAATKNTMNIPIVGRYVSKRHGSYTFATTDRITTGGDVMSVGAPADVFIGATQNVLYGVMDAVRPIDSLTYVTLAARSANGSMSKVAEGTDANGNKYYLVIGNEIGAEAYINSTFAYTQEYIEINLLEQLRLRRDALLMTGDSASVAAIVAATNKPAYWSKVDPDDPHFADPDYYVQICPENDKIYDDEVAAYNRQMVDWLSLLVQNEREKIAALRGSNGQLVGTWSTGGNISVSHSENYAYNEEYGNKLYYPGMTAIQTLPQSDLAVLLARVGTVIYEIYKKSVSTDTDSDKPLFEIAGKASGSKWQFDLTPTGSLDVNYDPNMQGEGHTKSVGFTLHGDDYGYESLNVSVYRVVKEKEGFNKESDQTRDYADADKDHLYGSYVYFLNGGATRCPWEAPDSTRFYSPRVPLSAGSLNLENPKLDIDVHERSNVPVDQPAIFNLRLTNEGEVPYGTGAYGITFRLKVLEGSNPKGVKIYIDGMPLLESGRDIRLVRGEIVNKRIEVYAGEGYDFEDITLELMSHCYRAAVSRSTFSVHYMPVACPVNIAAPRDNWVMNTLSPYDSAGWFMPVVIDGFDVNYKNFDHIEFQYKLSTHSDDAWVNLCSYYANDSLYALASGNKAMISGGRIENIRVYGERDPMEQQYDLRAVSFCRHGNGFITRASEVKRGMKDTRPPRVFGFPEPANGILSVGGNLKLRFNEAIAGNYLDEDNNFQLIGRTNAGGISTGISLHFDGTDNSFVRSVVARALAGKSFSIDMMVRPDNPHAAASFFEYETTDGKSLRFGKTEDNRLVLNVSGDPIYSLPLTEQMTAFTRIVAVYDHSKSKIRFYAGTEEVTNSVYDSVPLSIQALGSGLLCFGHGFAGNMMEVRVWSKALAADEVAETNMRRMTGYERELMAYYPMDNGFGRIIPDKASGVTLYTYGTTWEHQQGYSLRLRAGQQAKMAGNLLSRSNKQDETLMFWFKTAKADGTIFSAGRMGCDSLLTDAQKSKCKGTELAIENGMIVLRNYANEWIINGKYADNEWHHFVLTINRSRNHVAVYIDDEQKLSINASQFGEVSGEMYLGGNDFEGNIDEFAIFEQALPQSLMAAYGSISPMGDEMGLMGYLPFMEMKENDNGIMEQVFSVNDRRVFRTSEGQVVNKVQPLILSVSDGTPVSQMGDNTQSAPVQDIGQLKKMNFDWSFNNDELVINLNMLDREINKQTIYITVRDVEDLNGNPMASPVTWTAFVDHNNLKWASHSISKTAVYDSIGDTYEDIQIQNLSGHRHQYTIESLPDWLSVNRPSGSFDPTEDKTIRLTFSNDMPAGTYFDIIYLTDEEGMSDALQIEYVVKAVCPWEEPDAGKYTMNMSVCAQVLIGNTYDTDANDKVMAFFKNECVGMANVTINEVSNRSEVFLTIHGDDDMVRKDLSFRLWQASTGKEFALTPSSRIYFTHGLVIGCNEGQPVRMVTNGSEAQTITLSPGWNWVSLYLDLKHDSATSVNDFIFAEQKWTEGDRIKTPDSRAVSLYSDSAARFIGSLDSLKYTIMYMMYSKAGNTVHMNGDPIPSYLRKVSLHGDGQWNSLPCLFDQATSVTEALSDYYDNASIGDIIKSHTRFAYFTSDKQWVGSLQSLRPGEGYLLRRMGLGTVDVRFYNTATGAKAPRRMQGENILTAEESFSNPKASSNMTMIATILTNDESLMTNAQSPIIYVYAGNELAGIAESISLSAGEGRGEALYFLTIQSDKVGESLRFETEDGTILSTVGEPEGALYSPNSHAGSLEKPVLLKPIEELRPYKIIENNQVIIIRNNEKYDVTGKKL